MTRVQLFDKSNVLLSPAGPTGTADLILTADVLGAANSFEVANPNLLDPDNASGYTVAVELIDLRDSNGTTLNQNQVGRSFAFFDFTLDPASSGAFLPNVGEDGIFRFDVDVLEAELIQIDPFVVSGYEYATGPGNPNFRSVILPSVGDNEFLLSFIDPLTNAVVNEILLAGNEFLFPTGGVNAFTVRGIEASAGLDPLDGTAFVTTLSFTSDGRFTGTMTPLTTFVVPEPGALGLFALGLGVLGFRSRRVAARPIR